MQYRLRTLFIVVTVAAIACGWLRHEYDIVQERKAALELVHRFGGCWPLGQSSHPSLIRRWLGDKSVKVISLPLEIYADKERIESIFPEAYIGKHIPEPGKKRYPIPLPLDRDTILRRASVALGSSWGHSERHLVALEGPLACF